MVVEFVLAGEYDVVLVETGLGEGEIEVVCGYDCVEMGVDVDPGGVNREQMVMVWVLVNSEYGLFVEGACGNEFPPEVVGVEGRTERNNVLLVGDHGRVCKCAPEHLLIANNNIAWVNI